MVVDGPGVGELLIIGGVTLLVLAVPGLVLWLVFTAGRRTVRDERRGGPPSTG